MSIRYSSGKKPYLGSGAFFGALEGTISGDWRRELFLRSWQYINFLQSLKGLAEKSQGRLVNLLVDRLITNLEMEMYGSSTVWLAGLATDISFRPNRGNQSGVKKSCRKIRDENSHFSNVFSCQMSNVETWPTSFSDDDALTLEASRCIPPPMGLSCVFTLYTKFQSSHEGNVHAETSRPNELTRNSRALVPARES